MNPAQTDSILILMQSVEYKFPFYVSLITKKEKVPRHFPAT